jgi:heterodisulfide reductase subunit B
LSPRNLALAEKRGVDLVTPCSNCYVTLNKANRHLQEHPELAAQANEALAVAGLNYRGGIRVRHLAEVLVNDITPDFVASRVKRGLAGLRVAPYYGCQLVRPRYGFDDTENPNSLGRLVTCLGAAAVDFPLKARCCGGSLSLSEEGRVLDLMRRLLQSATASGAQCLVTPCPLCQTNLDAYQGRVNAAFKTDYKLPVLFITQLIGLALGIEAAALGLDTNIVSPNGVMEYIAKGVTA